MPDEIRTPHRRFARDRWPERLAGRRCGRVDARGKHLMIRFEGGLTIHSHLRMTGVVAGRAARRAVAPPSAAGVAGDPPRRPRGDPVRRPGARADDGLAHAARPADRRPRARRRDARAVRRRALPAPAARGRPDAPDRRRAARPAGRRRHGDRVAQRGVLARRGRPVAPDRRRLRRGGAGAVAQPCAPFMQKSAARRLPEPPPAGLQPRRQAVQPLRRERPRRHAGRRQPPAVLVPGVSDGDSRRPQGRRPASRRATRPRRSTPRSRPAST